MKIVLLCNPQGNQKALANKVAQSFHLAGIVVQDLKPKKVKSLTVSDMVNKIADRTVFRKIRNAWFGLLQHYDDRYASFPAVPTLTVEKINSDEAKGFIEKLQPDVIMVSGTSILKKKILSLSPSIGILNLHTGLSPYVKGAPNCTNWCLAKGDYHLIGNSVMWIDSGVDSGDLVATEVVKLTGNESLLDIHIKAMDAGHALYLKALQHLKQGKRLPKVKQQSIAEGVTYYNKDWDTGAKLALLRNLRHFRHIVNDRYYADHLKNIQLVEMDAQAAQNGVSA